MPTKTTLFISYRRADSAGFSGRIRDRLTQEFDTFYDTNNLSYGKSFPPQLKENVQTRDICLVIIGKESCREFQNRLEQAVDYVVEEIYHAHLAGRIILPVLIDGAMMPEESCLPEKIAFLSKINSYRIDHESFDRDIETLKAVIHQQPVARPDDLFIQEVFDALDRERLVVLFSQDFTPIESYHQQIRHTLEKRFDTAFYPISIPTYIDSAERYFGAIAQCCGINGTIRDILDWKEAMWKKLKSSPQELLLFITDIEEGNPELDRQLATTLRTLKSEFNHFHAILIGRKALAELVYREGELSPLNTAKRLFFPDSTMLLGEEQIAFIFHLLGKDRAELCKLLAKEQLGRHTFWSYNDLLKTPESNTITQADIDRTINEGTIEEYLKDWGSLSGDADKNRLDRVIVYLTIQRESFRLGDVVTLLTDQGVTVDTNLINESLDRLVVGYILRKLKGDYSYRVPLFKEKLLEDDIEILLAGDLAGL